MSWQPDALPPCVIAAAICALLIFGAPAHADTRPRIQAFWMTNTELRKSFAGAAIAGHYRDRRIFDERYNQSGSLNYVEPARKLNRAGHWSIIQGRFCTIYENSGNGGCFRVHQVSGNCFEFYFDTRTEAEARQSTLSKPRWTARAWRTDKVSTCQERPTV